MISVNEAKSRLASEIVIPGTENVPLADALGRILSKPLIARVEQPMFNNSAMDGYALRAEDIADADHDKKSVSLPVIGLSAAGRPFLSRLDKGCCVQIMTGAFIPEGADSIVPVENTAGYDEKKAVFYQSAKHGDHIRYAGEEVQVGERLLDTNQRLGPAELAIAASMGYSMLEVYRKPKIAFFATGDELKDPSEELKAGEIYNSNLYALKAMAESVGAEVVYAEVIRDKADSMKEFLKKAISSCDIICASGGISAGRFDFVKEAIEHFSVNEIFWKVKQKPGKPLYAASLAAFDGSNKYFFGLPGNPISSQTCFTFYLVPLILKSLGQRVPQTRKAQLMAPFKRDTDRYRFLFGELHYLDHKLCVRPTAKIGSNMVSGALNANVLIEIAPDEIALDCGDEVDVTPLYWSLAHTLFDVGGEDNL